jgi:hypothetical protein
VRTSLFQPYWMWAYLLRSLQCLKNARFFGRSYNESDVHFARSKFKEGMVTLDYRAFELTGMQTPQRLFLYVANQHSAAAALKKEGFWEGTRGKVALLPRIGEYGNEIQRVYLDCLAAGGRSLLDALAIQLRHPDEVRVRGLFQAELVEKVHGDLANSAAAEARQL